MIDIRKATPADEEPVWEIIRSVISKGDTYVFDPDTPRHTMLEYWFGPGKHTYVATEEGEVIGTFVIRNNQPGLGSHIANASYMVAEKAAGKGVGTAIGQFSIDEARRLGYRAMQFNIVMKSNSRAVHLWQKLGFTIIGEIPEAFNHREKGFTNAYIMYRRI